jgi:endonuclease/exonuclease/phosphatase family metal-dependent hydrolase
MALGEARDPTAAGRRILRLLTWNVHALPHLYGARQRLARVIAKINEVQPDVICLQEVWSGRHAKRLHRALGDEYAAVAMARRLRDWPCGGLLTFVRHASGLRGGPPTFVRYAAHGSRRRFWEGDGLGGKGILAVQLCRDGETLVIANTHLQAQYPHRGRAYPSVRRAQLAQLARWLGQLGAEEPVLLAGDFNTTPAESLYAAHVVVLGRDLTEPARQQVGGGTYLDRHSGAQTWIDYVLARGVAAQSSVARIENSAPDVPYSDHNGLLVDLVYAARGPTPRRAGATPFPLPR